MRTVAAASDAEALGDLDVEFHRFVIDRAGQEQCAQIWRSLQPRIRAHFRKEQKTQRLEGVVEEHARLLDALRTGDPAIVAQRVKEHVMTFPSHDHAPSSS
jgi:DNA-binding GntR family transcriptional regulator